MNRPFAYAIACLVSALLPSLCFSADSAQIERGRYLVEDVAHCQDCHTAQLPTGLDRAHWLKGANLPCAPAVNIPGWQTASPDITSTSPLWKGWSEAAAVKFLTTGLAPDGHPARPPMPMYKMKTADAQAVLAYLKSLK